MIRTIELPDNDIPRTPQADALATACIESALAAMSAHDQRRLLDYIDGWCAGGKTMRLSDVEYALAFLATGRIPAVQYDYA